MASIKDRLKQSSTGERVLEFDPLANEEGRFAYLRLDAIQADENQPRASFGDLEELAASIRLHGVISPIVVEPVDQRSYRIIAGERRYRASKIAGLLEIPAMVRSFEDQQRFEIQLIENLHRKDLNPIEEALGYRRLMTEFNLSQGAVGERVGKSRTSINESLRLLELPEEILEGCRTSDTVNKSVLLQIAKESNPDKQLALWNEAKVGNITVQRARKAVGENESVEKGSTHKIRTEHAEITIRFFSGDHSVEDCLDVLREALKFS